MCKINDVGPLAYVTDILRMMVNGHPNDKLGQLLPGPIRATPKSRRLRTTLMMQINKSRFNCVSAERWARKELSGCSAHE
ncbi:transposase domain-containing protein [Bradyrhizobium sp. RDT10]